MTPQEIEEMQQKRAYRHDVICGGLMGGGAASPSCRAPFPWTSLPSHPISTRPGASRLTLHERRPKPLAFLRRRHAAGPGAHLRLQERACGPEDDYLDEAAAATRATEAVRAVVPRHAAAEAPQAPAGADLDGADGDGAADRDTFPRWARG